MTFNPKITITVIAICVFALLSAIVLRLNIHGDAKFHTLFAKESAMGGILVKNQPYRIYDFIDGKPRQFPIAYPLTSESLFTIIYTFGGELGLKILSPMASLVVFLLIYLITKDLGLWTSLLTAFVGTFVLGERVIMTPLIEPLIVINMLAVVYLLKKFSQGSQKSFYLAAVFLGATVALKQQGLIYGVGLIFLFLILVIFRNKFKLQLVWKQFLVFVLIICAVSSFAIADQIKRNGTIAFAPGATEIPSFIPFHNTLQNLAKSNFDTKPQAIAAMKQVIGYNTDKISLIATFAGFILAPFLFYRSVNYDYYSKALSSIIFFFIIAGLLALINKFKNNIEFSFDLLLMTYLLGLEIISSFVLHTPITQYHPFGIILSVILISRTVHFIKNFSNLSFKVLSVVFVILFMIGYYQYIIPLWSSSGRENDYQIQSYEKMGEFIQSNLPKNSIFLAAETSFQYYSQRDTVWMNEALGDEVLDVLKSDDPQISLEKLSQLHANYVVIDRFQLDRNGVSDYLPSKGLVNLVSTPYFTKIYDSNDDGKITLYKINYEHS